MNPTITPSTKLKTETPLKIWLYETAERMNIFPNTLRMRIYRGKHPCPKIRKDNARVHFVVCEG